MRQTSLQALNEMLFMTMEKLHNNNDSSETTDTKETISLKDANCIVDLASVVVENYKVQVQALSLMANSENPTLAAKALISIGILSEEPKALGNG